MIELDKEINEAYEERDVARVAIINGAIILVTDLFRAEELIKLDCMRSLTILVLMQKPEIINKICLI